MFTVEIPTPPSLNNIYVNAGKKRIKSDEYAAWKREAAWTIAAQVPAALAIRGPIHVRLELPRDLAGDCDNRIKPALDSLVASGRIDDDRNVELVMAHRCRDDDKSILIVWSAKEDAFNWQPVGEAAKRGVSQIERVA